MPKASKARLAANARYDKAMTRQIGLKLNLTTDDDILARFEEVGNVQGYIKSLVRADMARESQEAQES